MATALGWDGDSYTLNRAEGGPGGRVQAGLATSPGCPELLGRRSGLFAHPPRPGHNPGGATRILVIGDMPVYCNASSPTAVTCLLTQQIPPPWDEDSVARGCSGEGQVPSTGLQPMRLPRGQHEEAVLCPVPSPTLLPIR